jgi:hypothetical protein
MNRCWPLLLLWLTACPDATTADFDGDGTEDFYDCAPADASIHPGAQEARDDGIDQDCDGSDLACDSDGDGVLAESCGGLDCDDSNGNRFSGAPEACNALDDDCDGDVPVTEVDADEDGFAPCEGDCDDFDPNRAPGLDEVCDGLDNDCNDELPASEVDGDLDGFVACAECDDDRPEAHPGAVEACNGLDDDCDDDVPPDEVDGDQDGSQACEECDDNDAKVEALDSDGDGSTTCDGDCDDTDPLRHPNAGDLPLDGLDSDCSGIDGVDADGDGTPGFDSAGPLPPEFAGLLDCDDNDASLNIADVDGDGSTTCDGDCDDDDPLVEALDADGDACDTCGPDGVPGTGDEDCDDADPTVLPGAEELCDGVDTDCDGALGPGDEDGDGDGDPACSDCEDGDPALTTLDLDGDGVLSCGNDCNDNDPAIRPDVFDLLGDEVDANCDGPDGNDNDGDGYAQGDDCDDSNATLNLDDLDGDGATTCGDDCDDSDATANSNDADFDGFSTCAGDCDDAAYSINPAAAELCDMIDNDCDGTQPASEVDNDGDGDPECSDCDDGDELVDSLDSDGDGFSSCEADCDDTDADFNPFAVDFLGDGVDSNCDSIDGVDSDGDGFALGVDCNDSDAAMNLADLDGDGTSTCDGDCDDDDPVLNANDGDFDGFTTCEGDCNDAAYAINPAAAEVCDLVDNNCDNVQAATEVDGDGDGDPACNDCQDGDPLIDNTDADGDGFSLCDGDCDDTSIVWNLVALDPVGDGWDTNCDFLDGVDLDQDRVASVASGGLDCDDDDPTVFPDAVEIPFDNIDQDCDGLDAIDADGDGFIDEASGGDDCDDTDPDTWPGAPDSFGDGIDQDCDEADGVDLDGDGWAGNASSGFDCDDADPAIHPGGFDALGDGVDSNCDGLDGTMYQEFEGTVTSNYDQLNADGNCDVNGDGFADLVIGETYAEFTYYGYQGVVWIFFGPVVTGTSVDQADVFLFGADDANLGNEVGCAGDTNGDGYDDLLVRGSGGEGVWLFPGPILGNQSSDAATHLDWVYSFELPGDVDGDGADDVLLCPPGWPAEPCGLHLSPWAGVTETTAPIATLDLGDNNLDTDVGDFDGDGTPDLLVGSLLSSVVAPNAGAAFVFDGPLWGTLDASTAAATLAPIAGWRHAGRQVSSLGDVDDDGNDDLLVGVACTVNCAELDPNVPASGGRAAVFLGPVSGWTNLTTADQNISVESQLQFAVACDLNDDGVSDLTLSDYATDPVTNASTYTLHHVPGPLHEAADPGPDQLLFEAQVSPQIGDDVPTVPRCAGDLTGQGKPDLLLDGYQSVVWLVPNPTQLFCTTTDVDGDGTTECDGDCADQDATIGPAAADDVGDRVDSDCDGVDGVDADGDGVASMASGGEDCDDTSPQVAPGAPENFGDGVDQDCDGLDAVDGDGDGEGSVASGGTDCDDGDPARRTAAVELCGDGIDQNCDDIDPWCPDPSFSLASAADLMLLGVAEDDEAGATIATGDFNGDGYDDLVVGAPEFAGPEGPRSGAIYVFNGPLSPGTLSVATADAVRWGSANFFMLYGSLANVGDMNGDGNDDLLVGTPRLLNNSSQMTGGALLLHGPITGSSTISAASADAAFHGENLSGNAGAAVGSGDFNGDGFRDLLIGAPNEGGNGASAGVVYVVNGPVLGESDLANADARLLGAAAYDLAGSVVAGAGDTDGDGIEDLLVVAGQAGVLMTNAGAAYLVRGPVAGDLDLDLADARILGVALNDFSYESGATGADLDGDGLSDLVIGSKGPTNRGVHVFYGPVSGDHTLLESDATLQGNGVGGSVRSAGDYNVDGMDDLLVSDSGLSTSTNLQGAGMAYLVPGPLAGDVDLGSSCARWEGEEEYEEFGAQLRAGGDLNNDGRLDFVFGAPGHSVGLNDRGAVYVVFGTEP